MELVAGKPGTLRVDFGEALDAAPTVAVVDANGDSVTVGTVVAGSGGVYTAPIDAQPLGVLRATWSGLLGGDAISETTVHEVSGNLLFTDAQARAKMISGQQTPLSSSSTYPDTRLAEVRREVTEWFEQKTNRSWVRRYCRAEFIGTGSKLLDLTAGQNRDADGNAVGGPGRFRDVAEIISVTIGGTAISDTFHIEGSLLAMENTTFSRSADPFNVVIEYAYGHDPVPPEARDNGLRLAMKILVPSDVPAYAQNFSGGGEATVSYPPGGFVLPPQTHDWLKRHRPVLIA